MGGTIAEGFLYDSVEYIANDSMCLKNTADVAQVVTYTYAFALHIQPHSSHIFGKEHPRRH
jgi:hypothetical protein